MTTKRLNPYQRLMQDVLRWASKVRYPKTRAMLYFPMEKVHNGSFNIHDLYERTVAAEQLGYDVVLKADDEGLHAKYVEKRPEVPFQWR